MAVIYVRLDAGPFYRNGNIKEIYAGNEDKIIIPASA